MAIGLGQWASAIVKERALAVGLKLYLGRGQ